MNRVRIRRIAAVLPLLMIVNFLIACGEEMKEQETQGKIEGLTLIGPQLEIGQMLPDATVVDNELKEVRISSFFGKKLIISTVPSLDTGVCSRQTHRFNDEAARLGDDVVILTISNDLPFAQKRFCLAEGIDRVRILSDYRGQQFGRAAGLFVKETYLLARAVVVVDPKGIVRYIQIVKKPGTEPDYAPVLEAIKALK